MLYLKNIYYSELHKNALKKSEKTTAKIVDLIE